MASCVNAAIGLLFELLAASRVTLPDVPFPFPVLLLAVTKALVIEPLSSAPVIWKKETLQSSCVSPPKATVVAPVVAPDAKAANIVILSALPVSAT